MDVVAAVTPGGAGGFRGRVEQQVDAITGSANRVLSGVVDSSFGVLRSILPIAGVSDGSAALTSADGSEEGLAASAPWNISRPGFGLLRGESGFSIASLAASLPGASGMRDRARSFASVHSGVGGGGGGGGYGQGGGGGYDGNMSYGAYDQPQDDMNGYNSNYDSSNSYYQNYGGASSQYGYNQGYGKQEGGI